MKSLLCANLKWRRTSWINIWKIGIKTRLLSLNFFALWKICTSITSKYWFFPSTLSFIWHVKLGNVYDRFLQNSANLQFSLPYLQSNSFSRLSYRVSILKAAYIFLRELHSFFLLSWSWSTSTKINTNQPSYHFVGIASPLFIFNKFYRLTNRKKIETWRKYEKKMNDRG